MKHSKHKYANACKQHPTCMADGGEVKKPKDQKKKDDYSDVDPSDVGTGGAAKAGDILRYKRKQQMEELGLKDGGRVTKRKRC